MTNIASRQDKTGPLMIRVLSRRGVVAVGGLEIQVVPHAIVEDVRAGRVHSMVLDRRCEGFAIDMETLLDLHDIPHGDTEIET